MENAHEELDPNQAARFREAQVVDWTGTDFRPDLAFPRLTEEMVERLKPYGHEETFPSDERLYSYELNYMFFIFLIHILNFVSIGYYLLYDL